jgi:phosphonatase-like hydrolase
MPLVDLIVFDIAGTTLKDRNDVNLCVREALLAAGHDVPIEQINPLMGLPKPVAIKALLGEDASDSQVDLIHDDFVEKMKRHYRTYPDVSPIDGVEEAFAAFRQAGVRVALDTGFSSDITSVILDRLGWDEAVIDGAISSDEVENGRPFPDMVFHHMKTFGIEDPKRVAKVGDAPADLNEGTNAGCGFVIGVLSGTHTAEQLSQYPHTHLVDAVQDLPALLLVEPPL